MRTKRSMKYNLFYEYCGKNSALKQFMLFSQNQFHTYGINSHVCRRQSSLHAIFYISTEKKRHTKRSRNSAWVSRYFVSFVKKRIPKQSLKMRRERMK